MFLRVLKLAISLLFYILNKYCRIILKLSGKNISPALVILTYHTVKEENSEKFSDQMDALLKAGRPVSLSDELSEAYNGNNIAVTFDDGFQSVLFNALPILHEKKIPATIFVPTDSLGKKPEWINDPHHDFADEFVLTKEQLRTLSSDLVEIGSHTVSHTKLDNVDESTIRREINKSKIKLEAIINKKVKFISVPYATFNEAFTDLFKKAGYERVFLNIPTFPATKTDLYVMGRISSEFDDWSIETRLKLLGAYQWLPLAIHIKSIFVAPDKTP
jgi:peptidoglycan/xylan/chitin deacetylase (PgdA/CDA1 family)